MSKRQKLTNREMEGILREHHMKILTLENKLRELGYYFRCYIEFRKTDKRFDRHFKKRFEEDQKKAQVEMEKQKNELQKNEAANRKNMEAAAGDKGRRPEGVRSNRQ